MNLTSTIDNNWAYDIQFGGQGAALFIIAYIGFYGLSIICLFGHQLRVTQRQRHESPAHFLKTLWEVPHKNKLYQELSDVENVKRIFRGYFADHESCSAITDNDLQTMVEERAYACAVKYRHKLRRLHLSHTDYYLDMIERIRYNDLEEKNSRVSASRNSSVHNTTVDDITTRNENEQDILSISVV